MDFGVLRTPILRIDYSVIRSLIINRNDTATGMLLVFTVVSHFRKMDASCSAQEGIEQYLA